MSQRFERDKTSFEQNSESIRHLNQILWQVPLIAMTLTGGLWYSVATTNSLPTVAVRALLLLTALVDIMLILVLLRVRWVMERYIEKARGFNPTSYPNTKKEFRCSALNSFFGNGVVVGVFCILLAVAGGMSFAGMVTLPGTLGTNAGKVSESSLQRNKSDF